MNSKKVKFKKDYMKWVKYFIFNFILFGVFFTFQCNEGEKVGAIDNPTFTIHQSNHEGNNGKTDSASYNAVGKGTDYYGTGWYVQGQGISMEDVVSLTLEVPYKKINGLVAFESGRTSSGTKNYDSYQKVDGTWKNVPTADFATVDGTDVTYLGLAPGEVLSSTNTMCTTTFATTAALSTKLAANANTTVDTVYSLLCITETEPDPSNASDKGSIKIQYAYTLRNPGYGLKKITFAIYNDEGYTWEPNEDEWNQPDTAATYVVEFVLSKPINEFEFTWQDDLTGADAVACGTDSSATGRPTTNNICVEYENAEDGSKTTEDKTIKINLPKEVAYVHDMSFTNDANGKPTAASILDNSLYATNTFSNYGSASGTYVRYYYYDFVLTDGAGGSGNTKMDPTSPYLITIAIDASGSYVFYITDIFGNKFNNSTTSVDVDDVSKTNIIVDYTNEVDLNLMKSSSGYSSSDWRQSWTFTLASPLEIDFTKIAKDDIEVVIYLFHKIYIENGIFAGSGSAASGETIEDIAKQPLGDAGGGKESPNFFKKIDIWRVATISGDEGATTNTSVSCGTYDKDTSTQNGLTISSGDYSGVGTDKRNNKVTFTATSNGRYRIIVTDNFGNTTDEKSTAGAGSDFEKNPAVEISVIDKTSPIVYRGSIAADGSISDKSAWSTSIDSYPYVIGGGEDKDSSPYIPNISSLTDTNDKNDGEYWKNTSNYTTIYYNAKGTKIFTYQDALEIAQIKVVDQVQYYNGTDMDKIYTNYTVNFGYAAGTCLTVSTGASSATAAGAYCDPTVGFKSDRNTSGTSYNLHDYIITNNFTSISGGLVKQVGYTDYTASDYAATNLHVGIDDDEAYATNKTVEFVNKKDAATFLGYLKIQFKTVAGAAICSFY